MITSTFTKNITSMLAVAVLTVGSAFASGSMSTPSGSSDDAYSTGKMIFFKKLTCKECAFAGRGKDGADARKLITDVSAADSKMKLSSDEMAALETYVKERFPADAMKK